MRAGILKIDDLCSMTTWRYLKMLQFRFGEAMALYDSKLLN